MAAVVVLAHIVRVDFDTMKVRNRAVLVLLALYGLWTALNGFQSLATDIGAGVLLFMIALVMWLVGAMGAGDVKLYAVLGMFIGFAHLGLYVILLVIVSVVFVVFLRISARMQGSGQIVSRMRDFNSSGKAPYAVPMGLAAIPAIVVRAFT
nr:A24 family peptidase [Sulfitobacter aestuariivivens]